MSVGSLTRNCGARCMMSWRLAACPAALLHSQPQQAVRPLCTRAVSLLDVLPGGPGGGRAAGHPSWAMGRRMLHTSAAARTIQETVSADGYDASRIQARSWLWVNEQRERGRQKTRDASRPRPRLPATCRRMPVAPPSLFDMYSVPPHCPLPLLTSPKCCAPPFTPPPTHAHRC